MIDHPGSEDAVVAQESGNRYQVGGPHIAHEVVDGEVVIINLRTGDYYSCVGVAAELWTRLADGASKFDAIAAVSERYDVGESALGADVAKFISALLGDDLLARADEEALYERSSVGGLPFDGPTGNYSAPVLEKFSEMADLILLDPVHDVSAEGWPSARTPE